MSHQLALCYRVIQERDITTPLAFGITIDDFIAHEAKALWSIIIGYYTDPRSAGSLPDATLLGMDATKGTFALGDCMPNLTMEHLCHEVRRWRVASEASQAVVKFSEAVAVHRLDPMGPLAELQGHVTRLMAIGTRANTDMSLLQGAQNLKRRIQRAGEGINLAKLSWPWEPLQQGTFGIQPDDYVVFYARPKQGKALTVTTPVLTPTGFVEIGSLYIGDSVIGADGNPCKVTGVYPQGMKETFKLVTSDGLDITCCGEHLWFTTTRNEERRSAPGRARSLHEISASLLASDGRDNHRLPVVEPVNFQALSTALPLDPYLLGALLGDGCFAKEITFCKPEEDVIAKIIEKLPNEDTATRYNEDRVAMLRIKRKVRTAAPSETLQALRDLELHGLKSPEKFIPRSYLMSSVDSRLALLQGLADTDGSVAYAALDFQVSSKRLAEDVAFLARSLGALVTTSERKTSYSYKGEVRTGLDAHRLRIRFTNGLCPVTSKKHLARWKTNAKDRHRTISSIVPAGKAECVCISVDSQDSLFVTKDFLVTHNTWLLAYLIAWAFHFEKRVLVYTKEMTPDNIYMRTLACIMRIAYTELRSAAMSQSAPLRPEDQAQLDSLILAMHNDANLASLVTVLSGRDVGAGQDTVPWLRSKIDRYKPEIMFIDGEYLLSDHRKSNSDHQRVMNISRDIRDMVLSTKVPVIGTMQANRKAEGNTAASGADIAYSDALAQDTTLFARIIKDKESPTSSVIIGGSREFDLHGFRTYFEPAKNFGFHSILNEKEIQKAIENDVGEEEKKEEKKAKTAKKAGNKPTKDTRTADEEHHFKTMPENLQ